MVHLPREIWLHVADYVAPLEMQDLYSLNSAFYHVAMEQKYGQISFAFLSDNMHKLLARLSDPVVARRVRKLLIHPHFLKQLQDEHTISLSRPNCHHRRIRQFFLDPFQIMPSKPPPISPDRMMNTIVHLLHKLPSLTDCHIAWYGLDSIGALPAQLLQPIIVQGNHQHLRKLSLDISHTALIHLLSCDSSAAKGKNVQSIPPNSFAPALEELDLLLRSTDPDTSLLAPLLSAFFQQIRHTLRSLSLRYWGAADMTSVFKCLAANPLPKLSSLTLHVPTDVPYLGSAHHLGVFLNVHSSTITSLHLRASAYQPAWPAPPAGRTSAPDTNLESWTVAALSQLQLPNLTELDMGLYDVPFECVLLCLQHFGGKLQRLGLNSNHGMSYAEVEAIISTLASAQYPKQPLRTLKLPIASLSPEIVDMMAEKLPELRNLEWSVSAVVQERNCPPIPASWEDDDNDEDEREKKVQTQPSQVMAQIHLFLDEISARHYPCWKLQRLSFLNCNGSLHHLFEPAFMKAIPTLRGMYCRRQTMS